MAARFMLMATGGIEKQEVVLDVEVPEQYTKMQEFDYTMPFGDVHITCAMNEAEDAFYLYFTALMICRFWKASLKRESPSSRLTVLVSWREMPRTS